MWQQHSSSRNLQKTPEYISESLFINMCRSFDWSHMATLFIWSSGRAMYTLVYFNPPIKIKTKTESKNLQPELFRGKYVWTHTHICDSRKSAGKTEGLQGWAGPKSSINLVILARISPNFLFLSRELHLVCSPKGVYSRKGGPIVLTFCFSI